MDPRRFRCCVATISPPISRPLLASRRRRQHDAGPSRPDGGGDRLPARACRRREFVAGVVGWLDMERRTSSDKLAARREASQIPRRPPDAARPRRRRLDSAADAFCENLAVLAEQRFPFEFLTYPRHLPHVLTALERTPGLHAVIDHLSKPPIAARRCEPWREAHGASRRASERKLQDFGDDHRGRSRLLDARAISSPMSTMSSRASAPTG